jgi:hypothetical protein
LTRRLPSPNHPRSQVGRARLQNRRHGGARGQQQPARDPRVQPAGRRCQGLCAGGAAGRPALWGQPNLRGHLQVGAGVLRRARARRLRRAAGLAAPSAAPVAVAAAGAGLRGSCCHAPHRLGCCCLTPLQVDDAHYGHLQKVPAGAPAAGRFLAQRLRGRLSRQRLYSLRQPCPTGSPSSSPRPFVLCCTAPRTATPRPAPPCRWPWWA